MRECQKIDTWKESLQSGSEKQSGYCYTKIRTFQIFGGRKNCRGLVAGELQDREESEGQPVGCVQRDLVSTCSL